MPYLAQTVRGDRLKSQATCKRPLGPGFPEEKAAEADKLEIWMTTVNEPYQACTFVLFKGDEEIGRREVVES